MKRILAWALTLILVLGLFAGCKKQEEAPATTQPVQEEVISANDAMAYLKALYPKTEEAQKTPINYERPGIIRVGGIPFTIVWSTDLPEEQIKIIVSEDGATVTIDVNEQCEADTPYVLTATITDEQGNTATATWDCILPEAVDMVSIVKEAYALKKGESLPYECTLRGKITNINAAWNPEYKNITVTIVVEGAEDMPIECYRLKGEGAEKLQVGNIITVTGTLKNYEGKIEFDAGCVLDAVEQGDAVEALTDVGEILKAAYKLKDGKSLGYSVELTGVVTTIDNPYDPGYKNISVVIEMEGYSKYPILCYRLKGEEAENIAIGDTITVTGLIKNYKGTIEFDAGCQLLKRVSGGGVAQKPSDDEDKILKDAKKLGADEKLPYVATLTGQVFSIDEKYSSQYDNITVTMKVSGTRIKCFHMKGDGVSKIKVGDTITVTGTIVNYKGETLEFSPATLTDRKAGNGKIKVELGPVSEDQVYYAEMKQATLGKNLYFNGKISNSGYLQTSDKSAEAVKISVEEVSGKGTRFYFDNNGTKTYIELKEVEVNGEAKQRAALVTEPTAYWNYDSELKVYFFDVNGVYCALGTYSNYDTISATKLGFLSTKNIGKSQFVVKYVTEPSEAPEQPDTPVNPGSSATVVEAPVAGTAYKFGMVQQNLGGKLYYITGVKGGYNNLYMATTLEYAEAADVYLEETTGGYYLYTNATGAKKYINMVVSGTYVNGEFQDAAATVYTFDATSKTLIANVNNTPYWFGTRNDKDYDTVGPVKTEYNGFYCQLYTLGEGGGSDTPVTPPATDVPTIVDAPAVGTAYKFGMVQQNLGGKLYYITGVKGGYNNLYMATTLEYAEAADVYLEETTGGYYLYTNATGAKKYINMVVSGTYVNGEFQDAAATVYTFDATSKTLIANVNNTPYWFGTRNDKDYDTVGPVKTEYNGFYCQLYTLGEGGGSDTPVTPPATDVPTIVDAPAVGTAYKFGMVQQNLGGKLYYITGVKGGYNNLYMATTLEYAEAADVYLEETTGGYYLYTNATGAKKYINMVVSGTYVNGEFQDAAATVYTFDATSKTLIANVNNTPYWFGTRNDKDYDTVGPVKTEYNGFYCQLYTLGEGGGSDTPVTPPATDVPTIVDAPAVGTAYKFGMVQQNLGGKLYYITGVKGGYNNLYMATTLEYAEAADVYLEETTGGYYLYTNATGAKKYINMVVSGTYVNGEFQDAAATVYTFDATSKTLIANVNNTPYWFGTRNDKDYDTVGPVKTEYNGFYCQLYTLGEGGGSDTPVTPPATDVPTIVDAPAVGTAYKFGMVQQNLGGKLYYITGVKGGYNNLYMATTLEYAEAADVYLEETTGGYYLYTNATGAKKYINMVVSGTYVNGEFQDAAATVYTFDATSKTLIANVNNTPYWFGTRNDKNYDTVGPVKTEYNGFYCQLYTLGEGGGSDTPVTPPATDVPTIVDAPAVGTAYKFGMVQQNLGGKLYYITGVKGGYNNLYMATTLEYAEAADVYLEETTGGYYLYTNATGAKKYINMVVSGTYVNGEFQDAAATVYTFDTTSKTLIANVNNTPYWFGTRNDKNYDTVGPVKTEYNGFYCQLYTVGQGGTTPEQPPVNPPAGNDLTIEEAIAMGTPMDHNAYTTEKYKITGVVDSIEHTVHGNMYIKDAQGNKILVYGTWDATGTTKYGDMATKPVAGDTVVLLSAVGNYDGTAQLKNAWIVEHLPSGNPAPEGPVIPEGGVSMDLTNEANKTAYSTTQQVWQQNGIKLTNNKAGSQTPVGNYCPIRLYKGSEVVIEYAGMTKLVFDCTNVDAKYSDYLFASLNATSGVTVTQEGKFITVVLSAKADSFTFIASAGQCRTSVVYVYTN